MNQVERALDYVGYEFSLFAHIVRQSDREDYFHPCNRDEWVPDFCRWLADKQRKSAEVRASND